MAGRRSTNVTGREAAVPNANNCLLKITVYSKNFAGQHSIVGYLKSTAMSILNKHRAGWFMLTPGGVNADLPFNRQIIYSDFSPT